MELEDQIEGPIELPDDFGGHMELGEFEGQESHFDGGLSGLWERVQQEDRAAGRRGSGPSVALEVKCERQKMEIASLREKLEEKAAYCTLCEQRILQLKPDHPLPVSSSMLVSPIRSRARAGEVEWRAEHGKVIAKLKASEAREERLRRSLQGVRKELEAAERQLTAQKRRDPESKFAAPAQRQSLEKTVLDDTRTIEELHAQIKILKKALQLRGDELGVSRGEGSLMMEIAKLRGELTSLRQSSERSDGNASQLEAEVRSLSASVKEKTQLLAERQSMVAELERQLSVLTQNDSSLAAQVQRLETEKKAVLSYMEEGMEREKDLKSQLAEAKQSSGEAGGAVADLKRQVASLQEQLKDGEGRLAAALAKSRSLAASNVNLQSQADASARQLKVKEAETEELAAVQSELLTRIKGDKSGAAALEKRNSELQLELSALKLSSGQQLSELESLRDRSATSSKLLEQQLQDTAEQLGTCRAERNAAVSDLDSAKREILQLKQRVESLEQQNSTWQSENAALTEELEGARAALAQLENARGEQQKELTDNAAELAELRKLRDVLKGAEADCKDCLDSLKTIGVEEPVASGTETAESYLMSPASTGGLRPVAGVDFQSRGTRANVWLSNPSLRSWLPCLATAASTLQHDLFQCDAERRSLETRLADCHSRLSDTSTNASGAIKALNDENNRLKEGGASTHARMVVAEGKVAELGKEKATLTGLLEGSERREQQCKGELLQARQELQSVSESRAEESAASEQMVEALDAAKEGLEGLAAEKEELEEEVARLRSNISTLTSEKLSLEREVDRVTETKGLLGQKNSELQTQTAELMEEVNRLRHECEQERVSKEATTIQLNNIKEQSIMVTSASQKEQRQLREELGSAAALVEEQNRLTSSLRMEKESLSSKVQSLSADLSEYERRVEELKTEAMTRDETLVAYDNTIHQLRQQLNSVTASESAKAKRLSLLETEMHNVREKTRSDIDMMQTELSTARQQAAEAVNREAEMRQALTARDAELDYTLRSQSGSQATLLNDLNRSRSELQVLLRERDALQHRLAVMQGQLVEAEARGGFSTSYTATTARPPPAPSTLHLSGFHAGASSPMFHSTLHQPQVTQPPPSGEEPATLERELLQALQENERLRDELTTSSIRPTGPVASTLPPMAPSTAGDGSPGRNVRVHRDGSVDITLLRQQEVSSRVGSAFRSSQSRFSTPTVNKTPFVSSTTASRLHERLRKAKETYASLRGTGGGSVL